MTRKKTPFVLAVSVCVNIILMAFVVLTMKRHEVLNVPSPNNTLAVSVVETFSLDPLNQIVYVKSPRGRKRILAHLDEDMDWVKSIEWVSDTDVRVTTVSYVFMHSTTSGMLERTPIQRLGQGKPSA
jgi:hypothetical protein